jgi:epsin
VGSENVVLYARENIYVVKTLKEFQHLEENGKDVGANGKVTTTTTKRAV